MNLNLCSTYPKPSPTAKVSIPIRDLMNLNLGGSESQKHRFRVSIPIRDLMNLNPYSLYISRATQEYSFNPY